MLGNKKEAAVMAESSAGGAVAPTSNGRDGALLKGLDARAMDWEASTVETIERSERRAWTVAAAAAAIAVLLAIAIATMLPLKAVVPYVVYVDKATGGTEVAYAAGEHEVAFRDINKMHWAAKYVRARESYQYTALQLDYDTVLALSSDDVGAIYAAQWSGSNAKDKQLGSAREELVEVLSVQLSPDGNNRANVRFRKTSRRAGQAIPDGEPRTYAVTMAFEMLPTMKGKIEDLMRNPLGFRVTAYRVDEELGGK